MKSLNELVSAEEFALSDFAKNVKVSDVCLGSNMQEHISGLYALEHLRIHGTVTGRWPSKNQFLSIPRTPILPALPDRRAAIQHTRRKHARDECS